MNGNTYRSLPAFAVAILINLVGCSFAQQPASHDAGAMSESDAGWMMGAVDAGPGTPPPAVDAGPGGPPPTVFRSCDWGAGGRRPYRFRVTALDPATGTLGTASCPGGWDPYALCVDASCTNVGSPGEDLDQIVRDNWHGEMDVGFRCSSSLAWQESLPADTAAPALGVRVEIWPVEGGSPIDVSSETRTVWNGRYNTLRVRLCYQSL